MNECYDRDRIEDTVFNVIKNKSEVSGQNLSKISSFIELFKSNTKNISVELNKFVADEVTFSHLLEEEQELELEIEQEEEKEFERPPPATPLKNNLDIDVKNLVIDGVFNEKSRSFLRLPQALDDCSLKKILQHDAWSEQLFVTKDFTRTVIITDEIDDYLRIPRWLCVHGQNEEMKIVFLSDFETNELFPYFKPSTAGLVLFLPRSREGQERTFSFNHVNIPDHLIEQLGVFTGSLYFNKKEEQDAFNLFIGYCPSPRNEIQQNFFENSFINQNGFVCLENREKVFEEDSFYKLSKFKNDPNELIIKLYELRNYGIVPKSSHHLKVLRSGRKNFFR